MCQQAHLRMGVPTHHGLLGIIVVKQWYRLFISLMIWKCMISCETGRKCLCFRLRDKLFLQWMCLMILIYFSRNFLKHESYKLPQALERLWVFVFLFNILSIISNTTWSIMKLKIHRLFLWIQIWINEKYPFISYFRVMINSGYKLMTV